MPRMGCYAKSSSALVSLVTWGLSDRSSSEEVDVHVRGGGLKKVVKKRSVGGREMGGSKIQ